MVAYVLESIVLRTPKSPLYPQEPKHDKSSRKNILIHLLWLKDKLENNVVNSLIWCDTRDMTADGHTKGKIPRTLIHEIMNGTLTINHPREILTLRKHAEIDPHLPPQALVQALFLSRRPQP